MLPKRRARVNQRDSSRKVKVTALNGWAICDLKSQRRRKSEYLEHSGVKSKALRMHGCRRTVFGVRKAQRVRCVFDNAWRTSMRQDDELSRNEPELCANWRAFDYLNSQAPRWQRGNLTPSPKNATGKLFTTQADDEKEAWRSCSVCHSIV